MLTRSRAQSHRLGIRPVEPEVEPELPVRLDRARWGSVDRSTLRNAGPDVIDLTEESLDDVQSGIQEGPDRSVNDVEDEFVRLRDEIIIHENTIDIAEDTDTPEARVAADLSNNNVADSSVILVDEIIAVAPENAAAQPTVVHGHISIENVVDIPEDSEDDSFESGEDDHYNANAGPPILRSGCSICLSTYQDLLKAGIELTSTQCGHIYCCECFAKAELDQLPRAKCPLCRCRIVSYHPIFL